MENRNFKTLVLENYEIKYYLEDFNPNDNNNNNKLEQNIVLELPGRNKFIVTRDGLMCKNLIKTLRLLCWSFKAINSFSDYLSDNNWKDNLKLDINNGLIKIKDD